LTSNFELVDPKRFKATRSRGGCNRVGSCNQFGGWPFQATCRCVLLAIGCIDDHPLGVDLMDFPILDLMDQDGCYHKLLDLLHPGGLACPRCATRDGLNVHRHRPSLRSSTTAAKAAAGSSTCLPAPPGRVHTSRPDPFDPPGHRAGGAYRETRP